MNKQELIKKIDNLQYSLSWNIPRINKEIVLDLIEQLDEPEKITIPQVAADWIKWTKAEGLDLQDAMNLIAGEENEKLLRWFYHESNQETFARAWLDGYEVEKEKRYLVKVKGIDSKSCYLKRVGNKWIISESDEHRYMYIHTAHTQKELEKAGFGWVFDCDGIEIEEVEE